MQTITRVYDTYGQARQAVADLEASGIKSSDINLIANKYICDETARLEEPSAAGPSAGVGAALGGVGMASSLGGGASRGGTAWAVPAGSRGGASTSSGAGVAVPDSFMSALPHDVRTEGTGTLTTAVRRPCEDGDIPRSSGKHMPEETPHGRHARRTPTT
jgi:hypothetical protein